MIRYILNVRNIEKTDSMEFHIQKRLRKINAICKHIDKCNLLINIEHKNSHTGELFAVTLNLNITGKPAIFVKKEYDNFYGALYAAFNAVERSLLNMIHDKNTRRGQLHSRVLDMFC